jgi:TM2 domain-containing membrane protein YozV
MNKKDLIFLTLGVIGFLSIYQAKYLYYEKKISSVANEQGMLIITLANFDENQGAYQGLADMFGTKSPLSGHIGDIFENKQKVQNQFYTFLTIGSVLILVSMWFFYSTYKNPPDDRQINKLFLILITFLLGGLGFHKFYTGNYKLGFLYASVFIVMSLIGLVAISGIAAFVEFIRYLTLKSDALQKKYEERRNQPFGFIW